MMNQKIINLKIRGRIFSYISKNPGIHQRAISRAMNIPKSTLVYHLNYLKKQDLIELRSDDYYKRYYPTNKVGEKNKELLNLFRQDVPRTIILLLIYFPDSSQIDIINYAKKWKNHPSKIGVYLDKHQTTLSYYYNRLVDMDIIEARPSGNKIKYRLKNEELIFDFLITYEKNFKKDDAAWRIIKRIIHPERYDVTKNIWETKIDTFFDIGYEIFPHPYHI